MSVDFPSGAAACQLRKLSGSTDLLVLGVQLLPAAEYPCQMTNFSAIRFSTRADSNLLPRAAKYAK